MQQKKELKQLKSKRRSLQNEVKTETKLAKKVDSAIKNVSLRSDHTKHLGQKFGVSGAEDFGFTVGASFDLYGDISKAIDENAKTDILLVYITISDIPKTSNGMQPLGTTNKVEHVEDHRYSKTSITIDESVIDQFAVLTNELGDLYFDLVLIKKVCRRRKHIFRKSP